MFFLNIKLGGNRIKIAVPARGDNENHTARTCIFKYIHVLVYVYEPMDILYKSRGAKHRGVRSTAKGGPID